MMDAVKICSAAIIVLFVLIGVREAKSGLLTSVRIAAVLSFGGIAALTYLPLYKEIGNIISGTVAARFLPILTRALGVAVLTQISADVCREGGEGGLAFCVETVGKMEILVIALPLVRETVSVIKELLAL